MKHLPGTLFEYDKHVEKGKTGRDHGEEVHGPGDVQRVAQERQPGGRLARRSLSTPFSKYGNVCGWGLRGEVATRSGLRRAPNERYRIYESEYL